VSVVVVVLGAFLLLPAACSSCLCFGHLGVVAAAAPNPAGVVVDLSTPASKIHNVRPAVLVTVLAAATAFDIVLGLGCCC